MFSHGREIFNERIIKINRYKLGVMLYSNSSISGIHRARRIIAQFETNIHSETNIHFQAIQDYLVRPSLKQNQDLKKNLNITIDRH